MKTDVWPALPLEEWQDTYATLHMWAQIIGKIRLAQTPFANQWWNVPLYVTARGLTTSPVPYHDRTFQIDFDFIDHQLLIQCDDGATKAIALAPRSVADFYREVMSTLQGLGIEVRIWPVPVEVKDPIPFEEDHRHASYDPEYVNRFRRILVQTDKVFTVFRSRFTNKCSPVHFFWGSFDLAVTRFSGRPAEPKPGADRITRLSYNAELSSLGFWPGGGEVKGAAFYSYAYPEPEGFRSQPVRPAAASYNEQIGEFLLMYDDVRGAENPASAILDFAESTYEAGARLQGWPMDEFKLQVEAHSAAAGNDPAKPASELASAKAPNPKGS